MKMLLVLVAAAALASGVYAYKTGNLPSAMQKALARMLDNAEGESEPDETEAAVPRLPTNVQNPLEFQGKARTLRASFALPAGHYSGERGIVALAAAPNAPCILEIAPGSVVEDVKFHVRDGAELAIRSSLMRRCHIYVDSSSKVHIDDAGLDHCELSGIGDSRRGFPVFKITNTVIAATFCFKPINMIGLELQDCLVLDQRQAARNLRVQAGGGISWRDLARAPHIRGTTFERCMVQKEVLFATLQCTFVDCMIEPGFPVADTPTIGPDMTLPIRWVNGQPAALPPPASGIQWDIPITPFDGGCTVVHQWDRTRLTLQQVVETAAPAPLLETLPGMVSTVAATGPMPDPAAAQPGPTPGAETVTVKRKQASVNGLLVMPLASGSEAAAVTKMNLTALPGPAGLRFSQYVGADMDAALHEVTKFMRLRHRDLPSDHGFEIAFEEKYSEKDGPSAAVACALLLESILTDVEFDPAFAVTGDLNADGAVQPVGAVASKIRGATNGSCRVVAIPVKNEAAVSDILVRHGPAPLARILVFSINHFDDALALATKTRAEPVREALAEMEQFSSVVTRDPRAIKSPQAAGRLQAVLTKAPNCLSAKFLLLYATGRAPARLSLAGSIDAADSDAQGLVAAVNHDFSRNASSLKLDELGGTLNRLRNLRPLLDQRVWPYVDSVVDFGDILRAVLLNPVRTNSKAAEFQNRARQAAQRVVANKNDLLNNAGVREELGL